MMMYHLTFSDGHHTGDTYLRQLGTKNNKDNNRTETKVCSNMQIVNKNNYLYMKNK